jgi:integration host factor subunit beta
LTFYQVLFYYKEPINFHHTLQEGGYMNKLELISALKTKANISKAEAANVIQIFFDNMSQAMAQGERIEIRGLCSFYVKNYKSYTGRNPKSGEKVVIKPKRLPFFKAGKELKERVDF